MEKNAMFFAFSPYFLRTFVAKTRKSMQLPEDFVRYTRYLMGDERFERFMQAAAPYENADVDVAREGLYPLFGETYYYEYYLMNNLPDY